ncbi:glycoside hydrolase family 3 N-terminal domain-containing protein [uncultured Draconibacterium sp.]|uniref:glycoside hydrolase family 3 protein n=1 Tax=uncultured Draconibacterium sp. TaxID=1573823 RepID=UPI002AA88AB7|nr:glycoside hydrolase family 3 N-terminal domain-containing protein [uncultured Draconibacterium sp.]
MKNLFVSVLKFNNLLNRLSGLSIVVFLTVVLFTSCKEQKSYEQPELGIKTVQLLQADGYQFKDLNKNNKLDKYEDWRLTTDERVADLLEQMTLEEKAGFMLISTINMGGASGSGFGGSQNVTSDLSEEDNINETNFFTRQPLPVPTLSVSGTTKGILERNLRHFILRANTKASTIAEWANNVQSVAETSRLGIPVLITSNPRNHVTIDNSPGLSLGETSFSKWPGELGLAAMRDFELTREFAETAAKEWVAVGVRKGYMYMADLATEPRWGRTEGTFGEDADLAANMMREVVLGFQGEKLGPNSVALTTKHFPGGGPQKEGQDAHFDWGKDQEYPGDMLDYHLKPFKAAIDAGTSAIMPYYAVPVNTKYEEVGFAFNKAIITDLLRGELGFQGIINSDTGPIFMMPWGVENLSLSERYQKALEAGVDLFSGVADPTFLLETINEGLVTEARIDESIARLLKEKFELGIFENPYVEVEAADQIVGNADFQERANLALRKSIVLLRNDDNLLPFKPKTKVYFEKYMVSRGSDNPHIVIIPETNNWNIEFVDSPDKADQVVLWLIPSSGGLFGSAGAEIHNELSKNNIDVDYVNQLKAQKPTTVAINFSNPWVISEIDSGNMNTVLATFGTTTDAFLDVVSGKFNPTGKMPFSIPASTEAVLNNLPDVPGAQEAKGYAVFDFDAGMSY